MTINERFFKLLDEKKGSQKDFCEATGSKFFCTRFHKVIRILQLSQLLLKVFQTFAVKSSHSTHLRIFLEQFKCDFLMRWICGRDTAAGVVRGHIVLCYCQF